MLSARNCCSSPLRQHITIILTRFANRESLVTTPFCNGRRKYCIEENTRLRTRGKYLFIVIVLSPRLIKGSLKTRYAGASCPIVFRDDFFCRDCRPLATTTMKLFTTQSNTKRVYFEHYYVFVFPSLPIP